MKRSYLEFPGQLVLHTCSPNDEIEVRIVWDLIPTNTQGKSVVPIREVLASSTISVADLSYFIIDAPSPVVKMALLMDFHPSENLKRALNITMAANFKGSQLKDSSIMRAMQNQGGDKDLANKVYQRNLILTCEFKFANTTDLFEDSKLLQGLARADNIYVMPREIKYDDYINNQFEALKKQHAKKGGVSA